MKAILFIFLLSLVSCKTTLETIECVAKNEKVITQVVNVIKSFKTKNFGTIFQAVLEAFFTIKDEVQKCLKEEEEPLLKITKKYEYNPIELEKCKMMCGDYFYDYECVKECNEKYGDGFEFNPEDIIINPDY